MKNKLHITIIRFLTKNIPASTYLKHNTIFPASTANRWTNGKELGSLTEVHALLCKNHKEIN